MSVFLAACAGLLLLSGLFYLFPRRAAARREDDPSRSNVEWLRLREAELAGEGNAQLTEDARLRLLEDEQQRAAAGGDELPEAASDRFPLWVLPLALVVFSGALYYRLGAAPDVLIARDLQTVSENSTPEQMQALMQAIETRAAQRPDNLHYVALLGRFYMGQQNYAKAAEVYAELAREAPQDAQALAYAAQAEYLSRGRELSSEAQMLAEQALAVDPHQRTALGLLGMASFESGQYRAAVEYWQRLLAMEPPGSESARMITGVIESARQRLGEGGGLPTGHPSVAQGESGGSAPAAAAAGPMASAGASGANAAAGGMGVTVRVSAPAGASIAPTDTVFVLARNAESQSRMPVAVQRLQASQLPVTLRLDDSKSMAGQKLSELASIVVLVQVSPDGRPGEAAATWLGSAGPLAPTPDEEPLEIVLAPKSSASG